VAADDQLASLAFRVRELTDETPEREAMLARLAEEIRTGEYQTDPDALAERLLKELQRRPKSPDQK